MPKYYTHDVKKVHTFGGEEQVTLAPGPYIRHTLDPLLAEENSFSLKF